MPEVGPPAPGQQRPDAGLLVGPLEDAWLSARCLRPVADKTTAGEFITAAWEAVAEADKQPSDTIKASFLPSSLFLPETQSRPESVWGVNILEK